MFDITTKKAVDEWMCLLDNHLTELKAHVKNEFRAQKTFASTDGQIHKKMIAEKVDAVRECSSMIKQYLCDSQSA